jgi:hypothetical protein
MDLGLGLGEAAGNFPAICFCGRRERKTKTNVVWFGVLCLTGRRGRVLCSRLEFGEEGKISIIGGAELGPLVFTSFWKRKGGFQI